MRSFVLMALVLAPALASNMEVSMASSLTFDAEGAKNRPVSKVINLLKDMLKQLEKEGDEDEETYDKMACWCITNDKEKTKSIGDAEARISDLTTKNEELTAASGRLNTEIANLKSEVAENQDALDKATAIRTKQLSEFNSEEKDLLGSISSLKSANAVLSKHNSFLQMPSSHVDGVKASVQNAMQKHSSLLAGVLTHSERKAVTSFIQAGAPSGEIFGILNQMKESFETNLATSQKEEGANQKAYEELKAAKENEISAGQDQADTKTQELADADSKNAQAAQDLEDTQASLAADQQFLASLKDQCATSDSEWEERQKTRQMEMEAVSKALAFLSSDEAHDLFTKTFNFMQMEMHSEHRVQASKLLSAVGQKFQNPRLATLAIRVRLDAFTKVKEEIDGMVADLGKQKADEIKHKDLCVKEFSSNQMQTEKKTRDRKDFSAKISDVEMDIKELKAAVATLNGEVAEMQTQLKTAGEERQAQEKEFQMTVADQRATQKLLAAALNALNGFYAKAAFAQTQAHENHAAPGVVAMITQIINDAKAMEAEAIHSEKDAKKNYAALVEDTNASIKAKSDSITEKDARKAKADANFVEAKEDKSDVMTELEQLASTNAELHKNCDFVTDNFEIRQTARDEEVEALKQAKAILSGAKFSAFLQAA